MIIGIDASNIRVGGGVTHLVELLRAADPSTHGFSRVVVWGGQATLRQIEERPWLVKCREPLLDKPLAFRTFWQRFKLSALARRAGCRVLLVPGGSYSGNFHPMVTMSRNLIPFEWRELRRFGYSWLAVKQLLLRFVQARTFSRADGLIFLTRYARDVVGRVLKAVPKEVAIVPHGVHNRFVMAPREQLNIDEYSSTRPFRILYVSTVDAFKHQWSVAEAVAQLRAAGFPVELDLVGPAYPPALKRLERTLDRIDPRRQFVHYAGPLPYTELHRCYAETALCLFASTCENMPNILLEGMAAGLPIACSNRGPMPEVLGDAGEYFDAESPDDIARALRRLLDSPQDRARKAASSFARAQAYSWIRCADETFGFLARVALATADSRLGAISDGRRC